MLISTMNDVPGYKVTSVLGEVFTAEMGGNRPAICAPGTAVVIEPIG